MIKIVDFLTEGNVIMLHKHLDKIGVVEVLLPSVNKYKNHQPIPYNIHTV